MFTVTINAKTPDEFKEKVKELYAMFPDSPASATKPGEQLTLPLAEEKKPEPVKTKPADGQAAAPAMERPTIEAMRLTVTEFQQQGEEKRAILKSLFTQYNAKGVSSLDPAHYVEFLTKLKTS